MSGGRFVLVILCLLFSYSVGAFAIMSWNAIKHREAPQTAQTPKITEESRALSRRALTPGAEPSGPGSASKTAIAAKTSPVLPTFDVVRIEPDGDAVFAGQAEPGWKVYLESEGSLIGNSTADSAGHWVIKPDKPISTGEHRIKLSARSPSSNYGEVSRKTIVVAVAKSRKMTPRIVLLDAAGKEEVIQKSSTAEIAATREKPGSKSTAVARAPEVEKSAKKPSADLPGSKTGKTTELATAKETSRPDVTEPSSAAGKETAVGEKSSIGKEVEKTKPSMLDGIRGFFNGGSRESEIAGGPAKEPSSEKQKTAVNAPPVPVPLVSIGKVEYEKSVGESGHLSIKGSALPGTSIRLYMGKKHIGTARAAASGDWSFRDQLPLPPGSYKLRAEQVDQSGKVLARADKSFEWALPKPATVARIEELQRADEPAATPTSPVSPTMNKNQPSEPPTAAAANKDLPKKVARAKEQAEPIGDLKFSSSAEVQPKSDLDKSPRLTSPPARSQREAVAEGTDKQTAALDTNQTSVRAKPNAGSRTKGSASRKRSWSRRSKWKKRKTLRVADARVARSTAMAKRLKLMRSRRMVVVRRGDTLWGIAKSYYGRGIRYKIIYRSNRHKIRDPHWIYPRQRFRLP